MRGRKGLFSLLLLPLLALAAVADAGAGASAKYVALTFDDGPRAETTERLLDGLVSRGAHATFFVIGEQIAGNEELLCRMKAEGHQVGNHTQSHVQLDTVSLSAALTEVTRTDLLLTELMGENDYWVRPPWGLIDEEKIRAMSVPLLHWSLDTEDWRLLDSDKVTSAVLRQVKDGDVVLLHDYYPTSVDAALRIVDALQKKGYQFLTVEELFRCKGIEPQPGVLYRGLKP